MKKLVLIIILTLLFSGLSAQNDTLPSLRQFFPDTCLQRLITLALDSNIDLRIARERTLEAEASLLAARSALFPKADLDAGTATQRFGSENSSTHRINLVPSWEVDIFGRQCNASRSAKAGLEAQQAYVLAVQTEMVATLAQSYYTLLMLRQQQRISRQSLVNWQQTEASLRALCDVGRTNEAAVLQARANILALQSEIVALQKNIQTTENSLYTMLGVSSCEPTAALRLDGDSFSATLLFPQENMDTSLPVCDNVVMFSDGIQLKMLVNRPDVQMAQKQLEAAGFDVKVARARFYPQITLSGIVGWTNEGLQVASPAQMLLNVAGQLTMPMLNHGAVVAENKAAESRRQQAFLSFRKTLLAAGQEVNDALASYQAAQQQLDFTIQRISTLGEVVEKTRLLMQYSSTTYLEVLTAEQDFLSAQTTALEHQYSRTTALISLYKALGGGTE